ncbi:DUF7829 domain-containing protein [Tenacibaculum xiamenense]|uniref:DUF7829 domain-containing protein n=1 Tax=Tenacibaculum xiamenense TaxID=1261553 RepID=UPI0038944E86
MDFWKEERVVSYLVEIEKFYKDCSTDFFPGINLLNQLNKQDKRELNKRLHLDKIIGCEKRLVLNVCIENQEKDNFSFYLIRTLDLDIEVNNYGSSKSTVFIELAKKYFKAKGWFHLQLFNLLFERGYVIKKEDINFVLELHKEIKKQSDFDKWAILRFATKLNNWEKFDIAMRKERELFTILSLKMGKPIYFNFPNLLGISNNAIQHYRESGDVILKAMDYYNRTSQIEKLDSKKGTFKRKKQEYFENKPIQDKDFEEVVFDIFPELK